MKRDVKPGQKVPVSGQYKVPGTKHEATLVAGEKVPPNSAGKRQSWRLVDPTKH